MAVRTRIQPFSQALDIIVRDTLSPAARSRAVAAFAREKLREAQAQNSRVLGREPAFRQFVDGTEGRPLEQVRADSGRIVFEFELTEDLVSTVLTLLERFSPVDSGDYKRSHIVFAGGRQVLPGEAVPMASDFVFLNPLPYARKIELGKMKMRRSGTDRVYQQAAQAAMRRFGNLARIQFSYRTPIGTQSNISRVGPLRVLRSVTGGGDGKGKGRFLTGSHTRAGNQAERASRVPAIIVTMK